MLNKHDFVLLDIDERLRCVGYQSTRISLILAFRTNSLKHTCKGLPVHSSLILQIAEKVPSLPFDKPSLLEVRKESVKLSWLPARTGNLPENACHITYTVEAREMPSNRWTRLASGLESTSYMARNLRPDKEYMFRVYAENKYGPSEPTLPATMASREGEGTGRDVQQHQDMSQCLTVQSIMSQRTCYQL